MRSELARSLMKTLVNPYSAICEVLTPAIATDFILHIATKVEEFWRR
jgi:hypothetical protein